MTRRRRDPVAEELKRAASAAACGAGLHLPPGRNGKCPRCKKKVPAADLGTAGVFGLFAAVAGLFMDGLRHGQHIGYLHNLGREYGQGIPGAFDTDPFDPYTRKPAIDWRAVLHFGKREPVTAEAINTRFKTLARMCHPDPARNEGGDPDLFIKITAARDAALKELEP